ncbi:transmembrane protein, putative [Medicago truncatula]|uniref:Transmembrane protein, putative n=1 Tax=Medicago truncatula TaxID=3880 RepID=A0A072VEE3_MEDTR|nr:transmembrane protein, putative [Medicago truncatula]
MNVTRAVTIGAQGSEGTSYHDGLFFSIFTFLVASAFPMYRRKSTSTIVAALLS